MSTLDQIRSKRDALRAEWLSAPQADQLAIELRGHSLSRLIKHLELHQELDQLPTDSYAGRIAARLQMAEAIRREWSA